jgi:hypothetical protein
VWEWPTTTDTLAYYDAEDKKCFEVGAVIDINRIIFLFVTDTPARVFVLGKPF